MKARDWRGFVVFLAFLAIVGLALLYWILASVSS
jgi:hypothetical protein